MAYPWSTIYNIESTSTLSSTWDFLTKVATLQLLLPLRRGSPGGMEPLGSAPTPIRLIPRVHFSIEYFSCVLKLSFIVEDGILTGSNTHQKTYHTVCGLGVSGLK